MLLFDFFSFFSFFYFPVFFFYLCITQFFLCLEALLSFLFIFKGSDLLHLKKFQVQTIVFNVFENLHNLQLKEPTIQHDFQTGKDILVVGMIKKWCSCYKESARSLPGSYCSNWSKLWLEKQMILKNNFFRNKTFEVRHVRYNRNLTTFS